MAELTALQNQMTDFVNQLKAITPGSGCYLNEVCLHRTPPLPHYWHGLSPMRSTDIAYFNA